MITNKPGEYYVINNDQRQRLGNKTLFNNIVPNQNNIGVRYYSSIDAEIYFEDVFVDEVVQISFAVQQQSLPLYGYNSYVYDDIALGSRIINGQFSINFTKANYMYEVLDTLVAIKNNNQAAFTKSISKHGPLWNKRFDIYMSYGDARQDNRPTHSTILVLKEVSLISCAQDLDYTGKPIFETYSFVAKEIDFLNEGAYIEDPEDNIEDEDENNNEAQNEENEEQIINPIKYVICGLNPDKTSLSSTFVFEPNLIIKSVLYKLGEYKVYEEIEELSNINTSEQNNYIIVDTGASRDQYVGFEDSFEDMKKYGSVAPRNFFLHAQVEYETFDGKTGNITQNFKLFG